MKSTKKRFKMLNWKGKRNKNKGNKMKRQTGSHWSIWIGREASQKQTEQEQIKHFRKDNGKSHKTEKKTKDQERNTHEQRKKWKYKGKRKERVGKEWGQRTEIGESTINLKLKLDQVKKVKWLFETSAI